MVCGVLWLDQWTKRARSQILAERQRARDESTAELQRARDRSVAELQQARTESAVERQRAQSELESLNRAINHGRDELANLREQLGAEARGYRERFAEYNQAVCCLCKELEDDHPTFVSILTQIPARDPEVVSFVYYVHDRWKKIKDGIQNVRRLVEAGIARQDHRDGNDFCCDDPRWHRRSAQWLD
jgi:hypothetical protein